MGGIETLDDVLEFFAAGAEAVQIGTANFTHPETAGKAEREGEGTVACAAGECRDKVPIAGSHRRPSSEEGPQEAVCKEGGLVRRH